MYNLCKLQSVLYVTYENKPNWLKMSQIDQNEPKWFENKPNWLKTSQIDQNKLNWLKMSKSDQNEPVIKIS